MPCQLETSESNPIRYSPGVRIGNWFEELCLREDKIRFFKWQRNKGNLVVDKTRALFDNFFKEIVLEAPKHIVHFDAIVQLVSSSMNLCDINMSDVNPALSVIINDRAVAKNQTINEKCELTVAPANYACVRNSFRIIRAASLGPSNQLTYGEHFRLQCVEPTDDPIYLYAAQKIMNLEPGINGSYLSYKCGEENLQMGLVRCCNVGPGTDVPRSFTNWFCLHADPKKRFESDGHPVPSNSPIVIVHAVTNRNLAVENIVVQTLFGPEFLVSVQSYRNQFKQETWKNLWIISNGLNFNTVKQITNIQNQDTA